MMLVIFYFNFQCLFVYFLSSSSSIIYVWKHKHVLTSVFVLIFRKVEWWFSFLSSYSSIFFPCFLLKVHLLDVCFFFSVSFIFFFSSSKSWWKTSLCVTLFYFSLFCCYFKFVTSLSFLLLLFLGFWFISPKWIFSLFCCYLFCFFVDTLFILYLLILCSYFMTFSLFLLFLKFMRLFKCRTDDVKGFWWR
jgi:hypothetical protein